VLFYKSLSEYRTQELARLQRLEESNIPERGVIAAVLSPAGRADAYAVNAAVEAIEVDSQGIVGDRHRCHSRPTNGREASLYPRGTLIRQHRHLFIVSRHDCQVLSERLGVAVTPALLGANMVIDRLDGAAFSISELPRGTHILVIPPQADTTPRPPIATLVHLGKQQGCGITGHAIAQHHGDPALVRAFRAGSTDNRGIICSVEYPVQPAATLTAGQQVVFRFPSGVIG